MSSIHDLTDGKVRGLQEVLDLLNREGLGVVVVDMSMEQDHVDLGFGYEMSRVPGLRRCRIVLEAVQTIDVRPFYMNPVTDDETYRESIGYERVTGFTGFVDFDDEEDHFGLGQPFDEFEEWL